MVLGHFSLVENVHSYLELIKCKELKVKFSQDLDLSKLIYVLNH